MKPIVLYDTATKSKRPLEPVDPGKVRVYSCGPTVYSRQHLGNLRTYVFSDVLRRTLEHFGYAVTHVINVTDVGHLTDDASAGDDKIERAARQSGERAVDVAERHFEQFRSDLARIGVLAPTSFCKATAHIPEQIELVQRLEARGFTYRLPDGIYFDTAKDPGYGRLAALDATSAHSRLEAAGDKRNAADFALWKLSPDTGPKRQLEWPSPWGVGFPGWHLECSAMASKHLGTAIDIHTGGVDHIPVHHVNEIAQSENAFDVHPWVRHWLHAAWLLLDGAKISKSAGSAPSLDDLVEHGIEPAAFRYYLSTAHYRAPLSLDLEALRAARTAWLRLSRFVRDAAVDDSGLAAPHPRRLELQREFDQALADDLDLPRAIATLWALQREASIPAGERARTINRLARAVGVELYVADEVRTDADDVAALVARRDAARAGGDYAGADAIREELVGRGVVLEDTPAGTRWRSA